MIPKALKDCWMKKDEGKDLYLDAVMSDKRDCKTA